LAHRLTRRDAGDIDASTPGDIDAGETSAHRIEGEADPLLVVTDGAPGLRAPARAAPPGLTGPPPGEAQPSVATLDLGLLKILVGDHDGLHARFAMWSKTTDRLYAETSAARTVLPRGLSY